MKVLDVKLVNLSAGQAVVDFDAALQKVLEDIVDQSTPPDKARTVTLKVRVVADEERRHLTYDHQVTTSMPGFLPRGGSAYLQHTSEGVRAVEVDPEQMTIGDAIVAADRAAVGGGDGANVARLRRKDGEA